MSDCAQKWVKMSKKLLLSTRQKVTVNFGSWVITQNYSCYSAIIRLFILYSYDNAVCWLVVGFYFIVIWFVFNWIGFSCVVGAARSSCLNVAMAMFVCWVWRLPTPITSIVSCHIHYLHHLPLVCRELVVVIARMFGSRHCLSHRRDVLLWFCATCEHDDDVMKMSLVGIPRAFSTQSKNAKTCLRHV